MKFVLVLAVLAACASQPAPRRPKAPFALACAPGQTATGRETVRGSEAWCEDLHGQRSGPYEWRYRDGSLAARGTYVAGERDKDFETWYPGGARRSVGRYAHGRRDGWWKEWHANGKVWLNGAYAAGARIGPWIEYDHAGAPMFEGTYVADRIEGPWRTFRDGKPFGSGVVRDGDLEGPLSLAGPSLRIEKVYRANKPHGLWRFFIDDRLRYEERYVDGVLHGRVIAYDETGKIVTVEVYDHGKKVEESGDAN